MKTTGAHLDNIVDGLLADHNNCELNGELHEAAVGRAAPDEGSERQ